jgi:VWFA-related protein
MRLFQHHRFLSFAIAIGLVLCLGGPRSLAQADVVSKLSADQNSPESAADVENGGIVISKQVNEVDLVFTVTDHHGHFVDKLPSEAFRLLDNHQEQRDFKYFHQQSNLPLRVVLLIDLSDSIRDRFKFEKEAASAFLKDIVRPNVDRAMVISFNSKVRVVHGFSGNVKSLNHSIQELQAGGDTAFYDAIAVASAQLRSEAGPRLTRRAIIVISDGVDTASERKLEKARQEALSSEEVIFALSTNSPAEPNAPGNLILRQLTTLTGGHILPAYERGDLKAAFRRVEKALRSEYVLGYSPAEVSEKGGFHSIELDARRRGLHVHCRKGYLLRPIPQRP